MTTDPVIALAWYDIVGLGGTVAILLAYFLLQAGRLRGDGLVYQLLNLFGAAGVLVSLLGTFNLSVFLLELAWVAVSAYGIVRGLRARRVRRAQSRGEVPPGGP
ncbi:CBU_0592 family membrane protein [Lysobacter humi (ex Lee et al. 2017)]